MSKSKANTSFFTQKEIHGIEYAQKEYSKECAKFATKLICTAVSLLAPLSLLLFFLWGDTGVLNVIESIMFWIACGSTLIINPIISIKTIWKFGTVGYLILPVIGFILGLFLAIALFLVFPTFYCIIGVVQSYRDWKDVRAYLELFYIEQQQNSIQSIKEN